MIIHPELKPLEGEREHNGFPVRSNVTWRNITNEALHERDKYKDALQALHQAKKYGEALKLLSEDGTRINQTMVKRCEQLFAIADSKRKAIFENSTSLE